MNRFDYERVLDFWFNPEVEPFWFAKSDDFDNNLRDEFYDMWRAGCEGLLYEWRSSVRGRLAEIIVLDQFSRNLCRGEACAFSQDGMALILSQEIINHPEFDSLSIAEKKFAIMPFMHSESLGIHEIAVPLFEELGDDVSTKFEYMHRDIIKEFGRYPHRNEALRRKSTYEEIMFLKQPGSSF